MTRAKELAYKTYPVPEDNNPTIHQQHCFGRQGVILGYQQAEKDLISKTRRWIAEIHRVCDITDENGYRIDLRHLQGEFEKYIKTE